MSRQIGGKAPQLHGVIEEALHREPFPAAADDERGDKGLLFLDIFAYRDLQRLGKRWMVGGGCIVYAAELKNLPD